MKHLILALVIVLALLAVLIDPLYVHADGETPPPPTETPFPTETPLTTVMATTEPVSTEVPVTAETPVDPTAVIETAFPVSETPENNGEPQPALTDILQEIPADTSIVVLDENGQSLPLVFQEAAEIIAEGGDPVWCPGTQAPTPGANGCSTSYGSLSDLVAGYIPTGNGTVWIQSGIQGGSAVIIDGNVNWSSAKNYTLTLQGGWNGDSEDSSIGSNSIFSVPITISNWNKDITIKNITISYPSPLTSASGITVTNSTGVVNLSNLTVDGATGTGIYVQTSGAINAKRISSSNNKTKGDGSCPANCGNGTYLIGDKGVTLSGDANGDNVFENNAWTGVDAYALHGNVSLSNITSYNNEFGVYVISNGNVDINNTETLSNREYGISIRTNENVILNTITSESNHYYGGYIYTNGSVDLKGTNSFSGNNGEGLYIYSDGSIVLNNMTVNRNSSHGAWLDNYYGTGVTITNSDISTNSFSNNNGAGLVTFSPGNINFNNITANSNSWDGLAFLNTGDINLNNIIANNNLWNGLYLSITGNIYVSDGAAKDNTGYGLYVYCAKSVNFDASRKPDILDEKIYIDPSCPTTVGYFESVIALSQGEFELDCSHVNAFAVRLPNGDLVNIFCPVSGTATIYRLDSTVLPANLPEGYTYSSGFTLNIRQNDNFISEIKEGGYIKATFVAPDLQLGETYSVLYWDIPTNSWIPLKDFMLDANGGVRTFTLSANPLDTRQIISGVRYVRMNGISHVEVSVNFPGIFVLAQH